MFTDMQAPEAAQDAFDAKKPVTAIEITGQVKWFDYRRGYGFVLDDNGGPDILVHITAVRAAGIEALFEGSGIRCLALQRDRGLQAFKILSVDPSTARVATPKTHVKVKAESDWEFASVKWYNRVKGYGFLTRGEGTDDIFFHADTLARFGFSEVQPGQILQTRFGRGPNGLMAAELRSNTRIEPPSASN